MAVTVKNISDVELFFGLPPRAASGAALALNDPLKDIRKNNIEIITESKI